MADDLDWLRKVFRKVDEPHVNGKIVNFSRAAQPPRNQSSTVLELVDQAADVLSGMENHARQVEVRAQSLVKNAIGKIQLLESQIASASEDLKVAQSRLATAESQLVHADQRIERAEARERELEYALSRIEDAIRERLLGIRGGNQAVAA